MNFRDLFLICALLAAVSGCAKKAPPKPIRTEPWLAHPSASADRADAGPDAAVATTRYVLTEQSRVLLELATRHGTLHGQLTRVSGAFEIPLDALAQTRGEVHADLSSLTLDDGSDESASAWLTQARNALGLSDAGAPAPEATFELTRLTDLSLDAIVGGGARNAKGVERVRGEANGNLLVNGFRVQKRIPLEAEFGFEAAAGTPASISIRSRAPLVVTLETHEIHLREPPSAHTEKRPGRSTPATHGVRVTLELYARKP